MAGIFDTLIDEVKSEAAAQQAAKTAASNTAANQSAQASFDTNVKKEGLSGDPEAHPFDPNAAWNPGAWQGSGEALTPPKIEPPVRKPIGEPIHRLPIRPVGGGPWPIRRAPHYGESFTARGGTYAPASGGMKPIKSEEMFNEA